MIAIVVALVMMAEPTNQQVNPEWNSGNPVLLEHAEEFDITLADFQSRTCEDQINLVRTDAVSGKATPYNRAIDHFVVVQSTRRAPGDDLNAVSFVAGQSPAKLAPGKRYLLVTYPPQHGYLEDVTWTLGSNSSGGNTRIKVLASLPSTDPSQETCKVALLSDAPTLQVGSRAWETLATSTAECLRVQDHENTMRVSAFLDSFSSPPGSGKNFRAEQSLVAAALKGQAAAARPDVRAVLLEALNRWGVPGLELQIEESLIECAHNPDAYVPGPDRWQFIRPIRGTGLVPEHLPTPDQTVRALAGANNMGIADYFLREAPATLTLSEDKALSIWLDAPDEKLRYDAISLFARSRHRPDLVPQRLSEGGVVTYPDLDDKVAAWKAFFEN